MGEALQHVDFLPRESNQDGADLVFPDNLSVSFSEMLQFAHESVQLALSFCADRKVPQRRDISAVGALSYGVVAGATPKMNAACASDKLIAFTWFHTKGAFFRFRSSPFAMLCGLEMGSKVVVGT